MVKLDKMRKVPWHLVHQHGKVGVHILVSSFTFQLKMAHVIVHIKGENIHKGCENGEDVEGEEKSRNTMIKKKEGQQSTEAPSKRCCQFWLGTVALHEITQYQKSTDLLIQKLPSA